MRITAFFLALALSLSIACSQSTAGLTVPKQQTFLLGEYADYGYRASLDNRGRSAVTVRLRDKQSKAVGQELLLVPGEKISVQVTAAEEVTVENATVSDADILVKMSRNVSGMSYLDNATNGDQSTVLQDAPSTSPAQTALGLSSSSPVADGPVDRLDLKLEPGTCLIVGEGTRDNYRAELKTYGDDVRVSVRNRETLLQTQGFGLAGRETISIGPDEVIYLINEGNEKIKLGVRFSESIEGARVAPLASLAD